jgi:predicted nucleotidyltransferase
MRLTPQQIQTIKQATTDIFGPEVRVWLFGSRAYDRKRGGDVDLMIETNRAVENEPMLAARLSARVSRSMQGRRVDVIVLAPGSTTRPIHREALSRGVQL